MKSYTINWANSGAVTEFFAESDTEAERIALDRIGYGSVAAEDWDANGVNDDEEPTKRLLIWACEEDSVNDPGANAVAYLETIGSP